MKLIPESFQNSTDWIHTKQDSKNNNYPWNYKIFYPFEFFKNVASPVTTDLYYNWLSYSYLICGANGTILRSYDPNFNKWHNQYSPTTEDLNFIVDTSPIIKFAFYSGDLNRVGAIDASYLSEVDIDAENSLNDYVKTDVNGDDFVDSADLSIVENNAQLGIFVVNP